MHVGVQFSVLGPVRLHKQGVEAGAGQPRQCAVLASLLLRAGKPVSLSKLVEDVWGDDAPPSAVGSVRTYVYRLRQALGEQSDSSVSLVDGGYLLHIQRDALDLNRFKETTARAREARSTGDLASAASLLTQGLESVNASASARRRNCSKSTSASSPDDSSSRKAPTARRARHRRPRITLRLSSQPPCRASSAARESRSRSSAWSPMQRRRPLWPSTRSADWPASERQLSPPPSPTVWLTASRTASSLQTWESVPHGARESLVEIRRKPCP